MSLQLVDWIGRQKPFQKERLKLLSVFVLVLVISVVHGQSTHIEWKYAVKQTSGKTYEIHLSAKLDEPWHIYSQTQPKGAINIPVSFDFAPNPLITLIGKPKEVGKMQKVKDKITGITANEYTNKVDFVQEIKLKAAVRTNLKGTISFQVCNEEMCLPPMTETINLSIK
jgi:hypothetical protein